MSPEGLSRRELLYRSGQIAAGLTIAGATTAAAQEPDGAGGAGGHVVLREGTNMSAALSPDGERIAVDLVTGIWVLPSTGGKATRLTDDLQDATLPTWSPDGRRIAFQSYRDGNFHLYVIDAAGGAPRKLTSGPHDHREPAFSPDGKRLAFSSDRDGSYGVWLLELASGAVTAVTTTPDEESTPKWSPDGLRLVFTVNDTAIDVVTIATGERKRLITATGIDKLYGPAFGPDGQTPSYMLLRGPDAHLMLGDEQVTRDEDVFGFAATWTGQDVLYVADGHIRRRSGTTRTDIPLEARVSVARRDYRHRVRDLESTGPRPVRGVASPVVSPDGSQIAYRALNAIHVVSSAGGAPKRVIDDHFFNSDPDFSPDGRSLLYASDRLGTADLWLRDLASGKDTVLTSLPGAQTMPRFSPDGRKVAYVDQDGAVWTLEVATGKVQQVTPALFMPGRPSWSPDGNVIALAAVKPFSKRFREGTSQILTVDLRSGELRYAEPMPFRSLATRGDDGPLWSPDGRHFAFVVESVAWVAPVDAAGKLLGAPRQVTREVTDSLAWQGSDTLVHLSNGQLKATRIDGGRTRVIRLAATWRRPAPPDRSIIHAGAVWDGEAERLRHDVDIVVEGGRIAEIRPHRGDAQTVDARGLVAMPGLVDAHVHWNLRGRAWGDRQGRLWLAYGVTTTRSPGDPAYQMVETREALESGSRVGPRFLATGEAVDGSRIYYNFMRPTLSRRQLDLEMSRAVALEYDMIKTYVRMPVEYQQMVVRAAHAAGIPLSSHYLYPAANVGMDGMEHTGATNRLGYSHTVSRTGRAYQDAVTLFTRSGMSLTPTLFNSKFMYGEDKSLFTDERTRVLFPQWEYDRLKAEVAAIGTPGAPTAKALAANVDMALRVHRGGGLVITGTDAPLDNVAVSLHQNLRAMVKFGFTAREALITATSNPARWLGLDNRIGVLKPGAYADLVLVDGNPLADIKAAAAVRRTVVGGVQRTVDELMAPFRSQVAVSAKAAANEVLPALPSAEQQHWWHEPEWATHICCDH
ncbi:amidohydrolase family protein [Kibdelosporangium phytohabitans]|uniref:Amidohydrolase n=1 Tax=Kibdelosporangium phytohabitans TaxID=860235 RepID=A0A0N9HUF3_9PSEU|nr:amidohydrolase family protein [Kibdelosporangium phytohabitans]ALG07134.1 amidohydrolase [Kibdelosporangium phytohabitans]MBE1468458.1 Tol biopolymer transport system component [Kibdelosporangium phytohabitans]